MTLALLLSGLEAHAIGLGLRITLQPIPLLIRVIRSIVISEGIPHLEILRVVFIAAGRCRSRDGMRTKWTATSHGRSRQLRRDGCRGLGDLC